MRRDHVINGVEQEVGTLGPVAIDRRSRYSAVLGDAGCGDLTSPMLDEKIGSGVEDDLAHSGGARVHAWLFHWIHDRVSDSPR